MAAIRRGAAWIHLGLVALVIAGVFAQVYLIGAYIFGAGDALEAHRTVGFAVHAFEVLILVAALIAWLPRTDLLLSFLMAVGGTVQLSLSDADDAWVGALHPLGALLVLVLGGAAAPRQVAAATRARRGVARRRVRRSRQLAALAASTAGLAAAAVAWRALWQEPRSGRVREHELALPRWPDELDGLRVALVSDLHAGAPHVDERAPRAARRGRNDAEPDLVLLLGDFIDPDVRFGSAVAPEAVASALGGLRARLGVVAVLGNHDWHHGGERVAAALEAAGIAALENDARDLGAAVGRGRRRCAAREERTSGVRWRVCPTARRSSCSATIRTPSRACPTGSR